MSAAADADAVQRKCSSCPDTETIVQPKCATCEATEDKLHRNIDGSDEEPQQGSGDAPMVQPKLHVTPPDDPQEREADMMADRVMRMPASAHQDSPSMVAGDGEQLSMQASDSAGDHVQRKCPECAIEPASSDEQTQDKEPDLEADPDTEPVNPKSERNSATAAPDGLHAALRTSRGGGRPMPTPLRADMENRFGEDFSAVRIHSDSNSASLAKSIHAQAFTYGSDIFFNPGRYDPSSTTGRTLLAHELTHVIQQKGTHPLKRKIQRSEEVGRLGNWAHHEIQERFRSKDADLITEGGIAGATRRGAQINSAGYTDFFKSPGNVLPGVQAEIRGADGDTTKKKYTYKTFLGPLNTRVRKIECRNGFKIGPRIGLGKTKTWDFTHNFPDKFEVGELKPLFPREFTESLAYHGTAWLQADGYINGYEAFIKQVHDDMGSPVPSDPKGKPLDFDEANIPDAINYRKFAQEKDSKGAGAILKKRTIGKDEFTPRVWVFKVQPGVFVYFLITHPFTKAAFRPGLDKQLEELTKVKKELHEKPDKMDTTAPKREPGAPPAGLAISRQPSKRVQAKDDDNTWREAHDKWEKHRKKWAKGEEPGVEKPKKFLKEQAKGVEKKAKADKKLGLTPSAAEAEQAKNVKDIRFWSSFWGRIYGALYFRFRKVFVKLEEFFGKLREKFKKHKDKADNLNKKGGIFDDWKKVATQVIIRLAVQVFKDMVSIAFTRFMNCINAIVEGILNKYVESFKKDLEEEFKKNEPLCCAVMGFKNDFDAEVVKHEKIIAEFTDAIETIQKWRDILSDVEIAVRIGVEVISCGAPPGLGCLWGLVAQLGISTGLSLLTRTSYFDDYIARPAAQAIMDSIVGDKFHNLMIDVMEMTPLKEHMQGLAPCARKTSGKGGGGGGGNGIGGHLDKLDPNDPVNAKARQEWEAQYKDKILEDLQEVFEKGDKTPISEEDLKKLVQALKDSKKTPAELKKMIQAARNSKSGKLDIDKAQAQLQGDVVPEDDKKERKIDYQQAQKLNEFYEKKIGWKPTTFAKLPDLKADSKAFADAVYDMQEATGAHPDGVAGPDTTVKFYKANGLAKDKVYDKAVDQGERERMDKAAGKERAEQMKWIEEFLKDPPVKAALAVPFASNDQLKKDLESLHWDNLPDGGIAFVKVGGRAIMAIKTDAGKTMGAYVHFVEREEKGVKKTRMIDTGPMFSRDKILDNDSVTLSFRDVDGHPGTLIISLGGQEKDTFSKPWHNYVGLIVEFE